MPDNIQASELALNFRSRIQELHQKSAAIDDKIRTALTEKLETTNAATQLVYAAQKDLRPDEFSLATDFLSIDAIRSYLSLGRKYQHEAPEAVNLSTSLKTVKAAMMLTGGIARPNGHGEQQLHEFNVHSKITTLVQTLASDFSKAIKRKPLCDWQPFELDGLLASLTPATRIAKTLNLEIQKRNER
jgi:hypothetical protein